MKAARREPFFTKSPIADDIPQWGFFGEKENREKNIESSAWPAHLGAPARPFSRACLREQGEEGRKQCLATMQWASVTDRTANAPTASFACCVAKCSRSPTRHAVPAKSAWPAMGFYHAKSLRHHASWKGSVVWAYCGRQSMARPRRHRPSPTACRGRSHSLMTVT